MLDGRRLKKKGFTMIECMGYIFISSILAFVIMALTVDVYKYSIERNKIIKREDEIDRAILNLKKIFSEIDNTNYIVKNNNIEIIKEIQSNENVDNNETIEVKSKRFEVISNNLYVKYYSYNKYTKEWKYKTSNMILDNVQDFKVYKKDKLIYIGLKVDDWEYFICM